MDRAAVVDAFRAQSRALVDQDLDALDRLLDDGYTAVHISGTVQTKAEWIRQITSGTMRYHATREQDVQVRLRDDTAVLTARTLVDATVYGARAEWPLLTRTTYRRRDGEWIAVSSSATTF